MQEMQEIYNWLYGLDQHTFTLQHQKQEMYIFGIIFTIIKCWMDNGISYIMVTREQIKEEK